MFTLYGALNLLKRAPGNLAQILPFTTIVHVQIKATNSIKGCCTLMMSLWPGPFSLELHRSSHLVLLTVPSNPLTVTGHKPAIGARPAIVCKREPKQ